MSAMAWSAAVVLLCGLWLASGLEQSEIDPASAETQCEACRAVVTETHKKFSDTSLVDLGATSRVDIILEEICDDQQNYVSYQFYPPLMRASCYIFIGRVFDDDPEGFERALYAFYKSRAHQRADITSDVFASHVNHMCFDVKPVCVGVDMEKLNDQSESKVVHV